jgi:hypothetical protein
MTAAARRGVCEQKWRVSECEGKEGNRGEGKRVCR